MFETIRMFIGFLFSLGLLGFSIYNRKAYGVKGTIIAVVVLGVASIIFLGQFISRL